MPVHQNSERLQCSACQEACATVVLCANQHILCETCVSCLAVSAPVLELIPRQVCPQRDLRVHYLSLEAPGVLHISKIVYMLLCLDPMVLVAAERSEVC